MPPPTKQAHDKLEKIRQYLSVGMDICGVVANDVLDNYAEESKIGREKIGEVEDVMLQFCEIDHDLGNFTKALDHVENQSSLLEDDDPIDLEDLLEKKLREFKETSKKRKAKDHEKWIALQESMKDITSNARGNVPAASDSVDIEVEDDDLEMTQAEINTKCPITGKEMVNPMKNSLCGHRYDRDGVLNYIKQRKGRAKCPIGACPNEEFLVEGHLQEDKELKRFIQRKGKEKGRRGKKM